MIHDPRRRTDFRRRLLRWYDKHQRDLPWRNNSDPYRVWISEVMLQQTQVETVKPYFERFTAAFPNVAALAAAEEQSVLRLWEGLGYYRRARALHAAAKQLVDRRDGKLPSDVAELMELPGIGRYTAGAIASIAFDQRAPILEANTLRLFSRLLAYRGDPAKAAGQKLLWGAAEELLPRRNVSRFNQGLMELGSLICRPERPACDACPVSMHCGALAEGLQASIPAAPRKQQFTVLHEVAVVVRRRGKVLVRQCVDGERWAGLWDFPRFASSGDGPLFVRDELVQKVREQAGVTVTPGPLLRTIKYGVTRYRITLDCFTADYAGGRTRSTKAKPMKWLRLEDLDVLPLSTTGRKIAKLLR